jgi:hypothetical protein
MNYKLLSIYLTLLIADINNRKKRGAVPTASYASIQKDSVLSLHHFVSQNDLGKTEFSLRTS